MVKSTSIREIEAFNLNIKAFYTTRDGGYSKEPYDSFNLGLHVQDDNDAVLKNRIMLENHLGRKVVFMNQTHSNNVTYVTNKDISDSQKMLDKTLPVGLGVDCDGIVTDSKNIALAVLTADCLPLLLATEDSSVIAAVHCGWKGIYGGIIKNAVDLIRSKSNAQIYAIIGACIGPESFEVGPELLEKFESVITDAKEAFVPTANSKYLCSLPKLCELSLNGLDIKKIYNLNLDTFKSDSHLFSYRRANITGRMASIIYINN